jgi:hypothetical protein
MPKRALVVMQATDDEWAKTTARQDAAFGALRKSALFANADRQARVRPECTSRQQRTQAAQPTDRSLRSVAAVTPEMRMDGAVVPKILRAMSDSPTAGKTRIDDGSHA